MEEKLTQRWLEAHKAMYQAATRHPFILSIRDGSVDLQAFKRWLGQDYYFVRSFTRFIANVLVKLPKDVDEADFDTILGGISALEQELSWFRLEASKWEVHLASIIVNEANLSYCRFLDELSEPSMAHAIAVAALWAIEVVYCESFAVCLEPGAKTPPEIRGACEWWGGPKFQKYCTVLQGMADKYLQKSPAVVQQEAEKAFVQVLSSEVEFWNATSVY